MFEWPHKIASALMAAYSRCLPQPTSVDYGESALVKSLQAARAIDKRERYIASDLHARRSAASRKGWRTRKAMAKAREKP